MSMSVEKRRKFLALMVSLNQLIDVKFSETHLEKYEI